MTITGVNLAVAAGIVAAIGDISRFYSPRKLVSYFGLNPARPAWPSGRRGGRGSQAHGALLAFGDEGRGLPVGAPGAGR
ncbi:transposase [Bradyrhizobium sp. 153]|uniref:transposase n=1 Tax=Bradyrhizobium sp. 153 TaxID=2782627 RepID=UPI001FF98C0D|nr:transposase [Bradyrhizobium sp. 153]